MRPIRVVVIQSLVAGLISIFALGCGSSAASSSTIVEEDDTSATTDEDTTAGDGSGDSSGCRTIGCVCSGPTGCNSGFCKLGPSGTGACVACVPTSDPTEICDGTDNDCDGATDEGSCPGQGDCQVGVCQNLQCALKKLGGILCNDGNACTAGDSCVSGDCQASPVTCDDSNICTTDSCNPAQGCVFLPIEATCDDGNACSLGDACQGGVCQGTSTKNCDDANPCTDDSCTFSSGACLATPNTATCDDGNSCTVGDGCIGGGCKPGDNVCPP